jgi:hypothetical protein
LVDLKTSSKRIICKDMNLSISGEWKEIKFLLTHIVSKVCWIFIYFIKKLILLWKFVFQLGFFMYSFLF